jgi:hypothetical protein
MVSPTSVVVAVQNQVSCRRNRTLAGNLVRTYELGGFVIESEFPFPELTAAETGETICAVRLVDTLPRSASSTNSLVRKQLPNGHGWLSTAKSEQGYLLRFQDLVTFLVSEDGDQVECHSDAPVPTETLRHLFIDAVFPLVLNLKGHDALHATAVDGPAGCCAFLGSSGIGKSTLAAALVRRGWQLVCDDCLHFDVGADGVTVVPGYGALRLWPDSIEAAFNNGSLLQTVQDRRKKRVEIAGMKSTYPVTLRRVYLLTGIQDPDDTRIRIESVPRRDAFIQLVRHAFRLDTGDRTMLARQFRSLQRLVKRVSICRLIYPRNFDHLQLLAAAIADDLKNGTVLPSLAGK